MPSELSKRCRDPISIRPPAENTASNIQLLRGGVGGAPRLFIHAAARENLRLLVGGKHFARPQRDLLAEYITPRLKATPLAAASHRVNTCDRQHTLTRFFLYLIKTRPDVIPPI